MCRCTRQFDNGGWGIGVWAKSERHSKRLTYRRPAKEPAPHQSHTNRLRYLVSRQLGATVRTRPTLKTTIDPPRADPHEPIGLSTTPSSLCDLRS